MYIARYHKDGTSQSLENHLLSCSALAKKFAHNVGLPSFGELGGLLHDLGKYSSEFQSYLKSAAGKLEPDDDEYVDAQGKKGKIDHSSAGAQYLWTAVEKEEPRVKLAGQVLALSLASHHSGLIDCLMPDGSDVFGKRMRKPSDKTHLKEIRPKVDPAISNSIQTILSTGQLKDEIQNFLELLFKGEPSPQIRELKLGMVARYIFSCVIDADRLDSAGRKPNDKPDWQPLVEIYEKHLVDLASQNRVDEIRSDISKSCLSFSSRERGLFRLSVPTGGGKTLASLRFALHHAQLHGMDRIIYVVPYTSIIDQNANVARKIFEPEGSAIIGGRQIVLEHHSNLSPKNDTWQTKVLSENWDAPIVFTTSVQLLESLFASGTRGARRMHQLANAVVVFDEIQTLPIKTVHLFNNAINFLVGSCGSSVVFCTATQPLLDKVDSAKGAARLADNPDMMSDTEKLFRDLRRVEVFDKRKPGGWSIDEVAETVREELAETGSVLVIVNTKLQARNLFNKCKKITEKIYHLSTSMCPAHRASIIDGMKECLPDNGNVICISTQLIEAGVDIDFGSVIRSFAGLGSIAQAAGRCNRNGNRSKGTVLVLNMSEENLTRLPEIRKAQEKCSRVLGAYRDDPDKYERDMLHPALMELYYKYYFYDRKDEMSYSIGKDRIGRDDNLLSMLSTNTGSVDAYKRSQRVAPPFSLRQSFKSAGEAFEVIDAPTEGVIVPYGDEGKRLIAELAAASPFEDKSLLLKRAQRFSVNLFPYELLKLKEGRNVYPAWEGSDYLCLDSGHYSEESGVSLEEVGPMDFLNV